MIEYSAEAIADLQAIRKRDGIEQMQTLFVWCEHLVEPATRLSAERLGGPEDLFRLRVGDYHIVFRLFDSDIHSSIRIYHVRPRRLMPPL